MNHFDSVQDSYSYKGFIQMMEVLVAEGKTTGPDQSQRLIQFTKLNLQRMNRWEKTFHLDEALAAKLRTVRPQNWWLITEGWCGDSAQTLSGMDKMTNASDGKIKLHIIMRDDNVSIMENYLTNGTKSIPILASFDDDGNELFRWGPRPKPAQKIMMDWKANNNGKTFDEIETILHTWYTADKGKTLQEEFLSVLNNLD